MILHRVFSISHGKRLRSERQSWRAGSRGPARPPPQPPCLPRRGPQGKRGGRHGKGTGARGARAGPRPPAGARREGSEIQAGSGETRVGGEAGGPARQTVPKAAAAGGEQRRSRTTFPEAPPAPGTFQGGLQAGAQRGSRGPGLAFSLPPRSPAAPLPSRRLRGTGAALPACLQAPGRGAPRRTRRPGGESQAPGTRALYPVSPAATQAPSPPLPPQPGPFRRLCAHRHPSGRGSGRRAAVPRSSAALGQPSAPSFSSPGPAAPRAPTDKGAPERDGHRPPLPCAAHRSRSRSVAAPPTSVYLCAQAEMQRQKKKKKIQNWKRLSPPSKEGERRGCKRSQRWPPTGGCHRDAQRRRSPSQRTQTPAGAGR